jgi:UDP-glucose 4-epimerase
VRIEPVHTEPRAGDVRHTQASIEAARQDLGHEPEVDFDEGLARTVAWFAGRSASAEPAADLAAAPAGTA